MSPGCVWVLHWEARWTPRLSMTHFSSAERIPCDMPVQTCLLRGAPHTRLGEDKCRRAAPNVLRRLYGRSLRSNSSLGLQAGSTPRPIVSPCSSAPKTCRRHTGSSPFRTRRGWGSLGLLSRQITHDDGGVRGSPEDEAPPDCTTPPVQRWEGGGSRRGVTAGNAERNLLQRAHTAPPTASTRGGWYTQEVSLFSRSGRQQRRCRDYKSCPLCNTPRAWLPSVHSRCVSSCQSASAVVHFPPQQDFKSAWPSW